MYFEATQHTVINKITKVNSLNHSFSILINGLFGLIADVDECSTGQANCAQTCINTDGGYKCDCQAGYSVNNDGTCSGDMLSSIDELEITFCDSIDHFHYRPYHHRHHHHHHHYHNYHHHHYHNY